jgi:hypothetical protein
MIYFYKLPKLLPSTRLVRHANIQICDIVTKVSNIKILEMAFMNIYLQHIMHMLLDVIYKVNYA